MAHIEDIGYGAGFVVFADEAERPTLTGVDRETADFAAMLLDAGIDDEDIEEMTNRADCARCDATVFVGQLDSSDRCPECQS